MFKKRTGGPAFKPKIGPHAARPTASTTPLPTPLTTQPISQSGAGDPTPQPTSSPGSSQSEPAFVAESTSERPSTAATNDTPHAEVSETSAPASSTARPRARPRLLANKGDSAAGIPTVPAVPTPIPDVAALLLSRSPAPPIMHALLQNVVPTFTATPTNVTSHLVATPAIAAPSHTIPESTQIPSIESIPELHTTASTPTASDDSQPTPTDSAAVSLAGSDAGSPSASHVVVPSTLRPPSVSASSATKRLRKPRAQTTIEVDPDDDSDADRPRRQRRTARSSSFSARTTPARSRHARSETPPDAENQTIDRKSLTMADLTRDLRIGKKFSRHDELKERERRARQRTLLAKELLPSIPTNVTLPPQPLPAVAAGPQFRIVDGQIVIDQSSLVVDRHAASALERENMISVEENNFTRLITSNSFRTGSKLRGPNHWTPTDTEKFYHALKMFGTDFEMISKMFPGRTRRHVKMKFNREERLAPGRINAALVGKKEVKMDIDTYKAETGIEFESVEAIEAAQRVLAEQHEAEERRMVEEQEADMRKKREELFRDERDGEGEDGEGMRTVVIDGDGPVDFGKLGIGKGRK